MSKTYELLTLRQDKAGQAGHWQTTPQSPYTNNSIAESNSISTTEPTSIPSPFARMELARTAFAIAATCKTWEEVPNRYKKIVSDCLDVAEIFFNYPMYSKNVEIIKWDKSNLSNTSFADTELGKSMKKFIQGDNGTYHFDRMSAIYLLNYVGDNRPNKTGLNIIGATSPITMFFSVDNDLSYVGKHIHFTNQDKPFDGNFNPLEKRDINFIQYMVDTINAYGQGQFAQDFKALYDYIIAATNRLDSSIQLTHNHTSYNTIESVVGTGDFVNVLGHYLGCAKEKEPTRSDFEIRSTLVTTGKLPLVLPVVIGTAYTYCSYIDINDKWGTGLCAPLSDSKALHERILPGRAVKYPYLTVADFFEDTIIKMPYKLNSAAYFNGNVESTKELDESYLLPFKPALFNYFTTDELKSMIKMTVSGSVVQITLEIPIQNYSGRSPISYVSYTKQYQQNKNEIHNIGDTTLAKFGLGVFPLVLTDDVRVADYRIALFDKTGISNVKFYHKANEVVDVKSKQRREYNTVCGIKTYVISKLHFDRIDICIGNTHGYIIPIFDKNEGTKKFHFAVDFGTTNTHIAYSVDNERDSSAFECKPQMIRLHESYGADKDIFAAFEDNYVPTATSMNFPMRSAFAEARPIDYRDVTYTLSDGNIPFRYEKVGPVDYLDIQTGEDLKWSANKGRIELYIRNIAFILHNKVLLEKGSLKDVQIRWFYPASMSKFVRDMMEKAWNNAYRDYFDANFTDGVEKITCMSESIAPYCHYINKDLAMGIVATIDIGGGTTDVYISDGQRNADGSNKDGYLMSFRCASNAIFGDGYNNNIHNNGFVRKYRPIFEDALKSDDALISAMKKIALKGNSSELTSFFFSLASQGKPGLNFLDKLVNDQKFKYVFLVFYSAIVYHVAQTMKAKGIDLPQTVAFSGNGSKTLQVISQNHKVQEMFVKNIFEKVYGKTYPKTSTFYLKFDNERPKEATANGGLEATIEQATAAPELVVLMGTDDQKFVQKETFAEISDVQKKAIVQNVIDFINFIPTLNENNVFGDAYSLDVSILNNVLDICKKDLDSYLTLGLEKVKRLLLEDATKTDLITESLFFYPIVGMLNNLTKELYELDVTS